MKIEMIKLYNGDYIIGESDDEMSTSNLIKMKNPRAFVFMPMGGGHVNAGFQPICMFSKKSKEEVTIQKNQIMIYIPNEDIPKEVINGYQSEVSGIEIATPSDVSAINKAGDFIM